MSKDQPNTYTIPEMDEFWPAKPEHRLSRAECPRVSTVLATLSKPSLINWAAKCERDAWETACEANEDGNGFAKIELLKRSVGDKLVYTKSRDAASDIGNELHKAINGADVFSTDGVKIAWASFCEWEAEVKPNILELEVRVYSKSQRYAGTPDALCKINDKFCLVDWKTSAAIYREYPLQVAAYLNAMDEMGRFENEEPSAAILRLPKTEDEKKKLQKKFGHPWEWQEYPWEEVVTVHGPAWESLLQVYWWSVGRR